MASTPETINTISRWLNYLLAIPMVIFGTIGAILTIIIFTRQNAFLRNPTINYLIAAAIITAFHLPTVYLQGILVDGFGLGIYNTNDPACRQHHYFFYMTTVITISFPCLAAFDQYASTSHDAVFRKRWSSVRVARCAIIGTILFWSIVYIPIILISSNVSGLCAFNDSPLSRFNDYFLTPVAYTIGPLVIIIVCTRGTIRNLQLSILNKRRNRLTAQIRRMLIPQLIILGTSGIPFGIFNIYVDITIQKSKTPTEMSIQNLFLQIIRLFYHLNFVSSFYIYLYMSSEVRKILKQLINNYYSRHNRIIPTEIPLNNSITLNTI